MLRDSRVLAMISHYVRSVKDEEYYGRFDVCGYRDEFDIANHTPWGLMRRAQKLEPSRFSMFLNGISPN